MKDKIKSLLNRLPYIRTLKREVERLKAFETALPPGHYHSSIPSKEEFERVEERLSRRRGKDLPAIDLNEAGQLRMLEQLKGYYPGDRFGDNKREGIRYYYDNGFFPYSDAVLLHCMMRHFRPRRLIEAGCGFSSAMMLDTNDMFLDGQCAFTFIDPYPEPRLLPAMTENDKKRCRVVVSRLEDEPLDTFRALERNDILFIDSSHISKAGSDLNYAIFEILPALKSGVLVHFHDIFFPYEYPREIFFDRGLILNEAYILRAFLEYNSAFRIVLFDDFMRKFHGDWFKANMPYCLKKSTGSIWLEKL